MSCYKPHYRLGRLEPMNDLESWWIGKDRAAFTATRIDRQPTLRARYGSRQEFTSGPIEAGWAERARRHTENEAAKLDRIAS
jgi:hypothetical protein